MHLRRRLVVAFLLAGGVAALAPADPALVLPAVTGLVAVLVVADVVLAPRPSALRPRRTVGSVLRMGRPAGVVVDLHNPTGRRLRVQLHDATPSSMHREPLRHRVVLRPEIELEGATADSVLAGVAERVVVPR